MHKILTKIVFGFLLIAGAGTGPAQSGEATFVLTNNAPYTIMIKFFSQNRGWEWPTATTHWTLTDNGEHAFRLGCQDGEKICYGGAYTADDRTYWGVGFNGNKSCKGCCLVCGDNVSHAWSLDE